MPAVELKVTLLNSASARFEPAKVIVPAIASSNVTVPVPASQEALVEELVHVPLTVQLSDPKSMADNADEILTSPATTTFPDVLVRLPPLNATAVPVPFTVKLNVFLASVPPETVRVVSTTMFVARVIVPPETVRLAKALSVESSVMVPAPSADPSNVTVLVPCVNVDPTPLVFQSFPTVHIPEVSVIVPFVPPVIVRFVTTTVDVLAVRIPPFPTVRSGVSAALPRARPEVASAVVELASDMVNVVSHLRPRVLIVNVWTVPALDEKLTLLNSASDRFVPANVIVPPVAEVKFTVVVPALQTAPSVEAFVHVPETFHVSLPNEMAEAADEMFTLPFTVIVPDVLVRSPPLNVRAAAVIVNVDLASVPPETVNVFVTTMLVAKVAVPVDMLRSSNVLSVASIVMVAVASNVTMPVPCVYVEPVPLVFQFPETVHAPVVTVMVPFIPPVIVTLVTVTVDAFAVNVPPFPTTRAAMLSPKSAVANAVVDDASDTVKVPPHRRARVAIVNVCAVPAEDVKVMLLNSASARLAPAKDIVPAVASSNVTVPVPASHTVPSVVALVHVPEMVHVSLPKSIALETDDMLTSPVTLPVPDVDVISPPLIVRLP